MKRIALVLLSLCMILGCFMIPATAAEVAAVDPKSWEAQAGYQPVTRTENTVTSEDGNTRTTTYTYSTGTVIVKTEKLTDGVVKAEKTDVTWTVNGATAYDLRYTNNTGKPHIIKDVEGLVNFANTVNGRGKGHGNSSVYLVADLDMSSVTDWFPIGYNLSSLKWKLKTESEYTEATKADSGKTIKATSGSYTGYDLSAFYYGGTFDGLGHSISNLTITDTTKTFTWGDLNIQITPSQFGLFGAVPNAANSIKNVVMTNCTVAATTGDDDTFSGVGAIVGRSYSGSYVISNCYVDEQSEVTGKVNVGGIVGNNGTISKCTNKATVTGTASHAAGVIGRSGTVSYCVNEGAVSGMGRVGGVAGFCPGSTNYCINKGSVTNGSAVGGVIGRLQGNNKNNTYTNLVNYGAVTNNANNTVGSIFGSIRLTTGDSYGAINNLYNYGTVTRTGMNLYFGLASYENNQIEVSLEQTDDTSIAGLLDVNYQLSNDNKSVRLNTTVDSLENYKAVHFIVNYNGQSASTPCTSVFSSVQGNDGEQIITYNPTDLGPSNAQYIAAINLINLPAGITFTVSAAVELEDGTLLTCGVSETITTPAAE